MSSSLVPTDLSISTPRLRLRAADISDVDFVWSATRFAGFNDGLTWKAPETSAELVPVAQANQERWRNGEAFMFTSLLGVAGDEPVGRTGLTRIGDESAWSFGFWVHPVHWGRGYATEAGAAVLEFGFARLRAARIVTAHAIWNTASQRVIEKLGFRCTGENPCGFEKHGRPVAEYEYEMLIDEH